MSSWLPLPQGRGFEGCIAWKKTRHYPCHAELQYDFSSYRCCSRREPLGQNSDPKPSQMICCSRLFSIYDLSLNDEIPYCWKNADLVEASMSAITDTAIFQGIRSFDCCGPAYKFLRSSMCASQKQEGQRNHWPTRPKYSICGK